MSRFFATGSDSESEATSSDDELPQRPTAAPKIFQFEDVEEETKRVVRSAKDKRFEEIKNIIKILKNHKKIKDMANILDDFEDLGRAFDKAKKIVEKEGIPRFYVRCLVELEDFINECWEDREGRKSMSKNNSRSLTSIRQKLKKYNREYETELAEYRENPDTGEVADSDEEGDSDEDSEMSSSSEDEDEVIDQSKKFLKADDQDDDDDYSSWIEESSGSSDEEIKYTGTLTADFFRKKATDPADEEKKRRKDEKREQRKTRQKLSDDEEPVDDDEGGEWKKIKGGTPAVKEKQKMFAKDAEINHEAVKKKLVELASGRGRKSTDRSEQMEMLLELRTIAKEHNLGDAIDIKILFRIIGALYDYNPNIATSMKPDVWEKCMSHIEELVDLLTQNGDNIICAENVEPDAETFSGNYPHRVRGCALTAVERMDDEYIKMLQACDAHSTEYVERLKDENRVCAMIEKLSNYCEDRATTSELCRIYLKIIHHVYYKFDFEAMIAKRDAGKPKLEKAEKKEVNEEKKEVNGEVEEEEPQAKPLGQGNSKNLMDRLCKFIYAKDTTDRIRTQALLCHIYHHGLHDRWFEARDLMLMSHLQDTIQHSDIPTQIMYNRGMVQLGLCAFRQGMIKDAHSCLVDIQSSSRAKELLAQGLLLQRQHERTPEQEKIEKRRQKPYHMHINLELLECVYLVSAMLLEIPYMAAHEFDARRRMISKNFHHVLRMSERQTLVGPPESMREHVVAASKAMKNGDWRTCKEYLINEKMNAKVWDLFFDSDVVRNMIIQKVKEESLRTYLFSYSSVYNSLDLFKLADMFDLDMASTHSIISKMIINEELMASLDEPTKSVNMHRTEPTRLQSLALQLSEKVSNLMENNEKMVEMKQGGFYQRQNQQGGYQGGDQRQGNYKRDNQQSGYQQGGYRRDGQNQGYRRDGNRDGGYRREGGYRGNHGGYRRGGGYRGRGGYRGDRGDRD